MFEKIKEYFSRAILGLFFYVIMYFLVNLTRVKPAVELVTILVLALDKKTYEILLSKKISDRLDAKLSFYKFFWVIIYASAKFTSSLRELIIDWSTTQSAKFTGLLSTYQAYEVFFTLMVSIAAFVGGILILFLLLNFISKKDTKE
ncbi:hypothetical protein [Enterococcus sp. AZ109]|uniref:hypothetical protein n=1 Tax=Enterococcus sp. AZ109 TaxID=2774634 RepID=UPI003F2893C3